MDTSHPGQAAASMPCPSPPPPGWVDRQATEASRLWVPSPLAWLRCGGPLSGQSLSAPGILLDATAQGQPLGVGWRAGSVFCQGSLKNRFAATLCDLSSPISVLFWAGLVLIEAVASPGEGRALGWE